MEPVLKIASYIYQRYMKQFGTPIGEMKLHKLLYFAQREAIILTGEPLFKERFEAWVYGPVIPCVRSYYKNGVLATTEADDVGTKFGAVFDKVFNHYALKDAWSLSSLTHGEYSWQHAREGVKPAEPSANELLLNDIRKDAQRIKTRRTLLKYVNEKNH